MVRFPGPRDRQHFLYQNCASWRVYDYLKVEPDAIAAVDELRNDWYSRQPWRYQMAPHEPHIYWVMMLGALEPDSCPYIRPNPDKTTWGEVSHLVRYCIRMQSVLRAMLVRFEYQGRMDWLTMMQFALLFAQLNIKARASEEWIQRREMARQNRALGRQESSGPN
ncbi:hypothetical protein FSARC_10169 [Fusarium sarcochroum]|uniref:Uncharacterized protein n=1 Tax=Fusarium sarcochroum TaxID=1208366 RepID=A0A8H4TP36_9HYPO|nr:hypothetical protein FSARC_10169 [Fusarium sarcochroum]